jgi:hypothetical protein
MRRNKQRRFEVTLQRILNEYPTESLERMQTWAAHGRLTHTWDACLNAAAVGHPVGGPFTVEQELGVPAALADLMANLWDRLGDQDACQRRTQQLVGEILASRARRATRAVSAAGPSAPLPALDAPQVPAAIR